MSLSFNSKAINVAKSVSDFEPQTVRRILGRSGDKAITLGLIIDSRFTTASNVSQVAVAVIAITWTDDGSKYRSSPIFAKIVRKSSPL